MTKCCRNFILGLYHVLRLVSEKEKETKAYKFFHNSMPFYTQSTIKFCCIFDKAFDCLNVARISWNCKEALKPYTRLDDP